MLIEVKCDGKQVDCTQINTFPQPQAAHLEVESLNASTFDRIGRGEIAALAILMISVYFD